MYNLYQYPLPPQNYIGEELLLGIILIYPNTLPHIIPFIRAEYFFLECHQIIYSHLLNVHKKYKLHTIELFYHLSDKQILYYIGGIHKIIDLMKQGHIFIYSNQINLYIEELIELINSNYIKRLLIQYGQNIIQLAYIKQVSTYKVYNKASSYLHYTETLIPKNKLKNFNELIGDFLLNIQNLAKHKKIDPTSITNKNQLQSGFKTLDKVIKNLPNGELIIIAGRPSIGKTSFVVNLTCNLLQKHQIGLCFFSLEMNSQQILTKIITTYSKISYKHIQLNLLNLNEWNNIKTTCLQLLENYMYINDTSNVSMDYIEYTCKLLKKDNDKIGLIVIDYLQLVQTDNYLYGNRVQELSYITRKMKLLAQYLNIPVIVLSQLNRNIENRSNKLPLLSDLKESGCIYYKNHICIHTGTSLINNATINSITKLSYPINIYRANTCYIFTNNLYKIFIYNTRILFFLEYIFTCELFNKYYINLTINHKYIHYSNWINNAFTIDTTSILNKSKQLYRWITYIRKITFYTYAIVYDMMIKNYFHFISQRLILHNSIEQDADIILILYNKLEISDQDSKNKYIDLVIAKNRNGPTGSCQILFKPDQNTFIDHNNTNNAYIP